MPKDKIGDVKVMNNEYDNEKFFEEYAKMSRSKEGLKAAGEWHQLKPLFPSLEGKSVLDLGCGYGWHCKFAEEQGATKILGIDLSKKMIEEAQKRNSGNQIEYRISGLEEYDYPENEWDCVISNLALHYIEDIVEIFQKVYRTLKPGGIFLFNIEHPVFTAGVGQDWIYTDDGKPQYWAIDNYFITGERNTHFLGCDVVKQHHTLTQIIMGLLKGIVIPSDKEKIIALANKYIEKENVDALILACTELPLAIKPEDVNVPIVNTTQVHINAIYQYAIR